MKEPPIDVRRHWTFMYFGIHYNMNFILVNTGNSGNVSL